MADRASIVPQLLGAAVGIVLGSVLLFVVLGMLRDDSTTPEVTAGPDATASEAVASEQPDAEPSSPTGETEQPSEAPTSEEPSEAPSPLASVDPASVSIQVLDAAGDDGSAAEAVADELREAGYDVIVVNRAGRGYEETTIFWSPEQEDAGRQVAAELGTDRAEQTPDEVRLSDSVDVHVVVGADRA